MFRHIRGGSCSGNSENVPGPGSQGEHMANNWQTLLGSTRWAGLLDPLDLDLRRVIIHYGEMAQATYDSFDREKLSKYAGSSRFSKKNFFKNLGLDHGHPYKYRVTKFIYATSGINMPDSLILKSLSRDAWSTESNFIGYVAVAEDASVAVLGRRDIVVAWRGTTQNLEWVNDLQFHRVPATDILGKEGRKDTKVHRGWYMIYTSDDPKSRFSKTSARNQVLSELTRLLEIYKDEEVSITVTGHSLGAALATLNAVDIVANNINKNRMVTAMVYGSPRVGGETFKKKSLHYDDLRILRIENASDIVPNYPLTLQGYYHLGEGLRIDTRLSTYMKINRSLSTWQWHNLEVYLHGIAGTNGSKGGFKMVIERDITLINKIGDNLKDEYLIPIAWWVHMKKGMIQQPDGSWVLMEHEIEDEDN